MAKKDILHQLILSLNKEEKKTFKYATFNIIKKDKGNYLKIYDILSKMKEYDEKKLIEKLKPYISSENITQSKKYLKDAIIKSLVNKNQNNEIEIVLNHIKIYKFYRSKLLISESVKALKLAKKMAIKYQTYDLHLDILNYEFSLNLKIDFKNIDSLFENNITEKEKLLFNYKTFRSLESLLSFTYKTYQQFHTKTPKEYLDKIKTELETYDLKEITDFKILNRYYRVSSFYYLMIGDRNLDSYSVKKIKELYEANIDFLNFEREAYVNSIINYLGSLFSLGKFESLINEINRYKKFKTKSENEFINLHFALIKYESLYFLNNGITDFSLEETERFLGKYASKISDTSIITIHLNYALLYYFKGDFESAAFWTDKVFQDNLKGRKDLQIKIAFLKIISNFELSNFEYLESLLRTFKRNFELNSFELLFIKLIQDGVKTNNKKLFENFVLKAQNISASDQKAYSFLFLWIDSKIVNKPIKQLYLESLNLN